MDSCFPVGNLWLMALILHCKAAGFSVSIANNQTLDQGLVTAALRWGWQRLKQPPVIALTVFARWPQEGGSCEAIANTVK
jgi:hypothetical protein